MRKLIFYLILLLSTALLVSPVQGYQVSGPLLSGGIPGGLYSLGNILSKLVLWAFSLGGIIAFLFLIYGGFKYLTSAGDQKATTSAQHTITAALIGLGIVFASYWIANILESVLGLKITTFNPVPSAYAAVNIGDSFKLSDTRSIDQLFPRSATVEGLGSFLQYLIPAILTIAGLTFLAYVITSGFRYITSGGDQKAIDSAKKTLTYAFLGLLIVFASYWIIQIIQTVTGIEIFL